MKEARTAKAMTRLASMSAAVIGAAHIISGADIAKRLKSVEKKIDLLLACRQMDQLARLEGIYASAKELGVRPLTVEKHMELWHLRKELRVLRYTWRRELEHHLNQIQDPKSVWWLRRMFSRQERIDGRIKEQITEGELQFGLIEYSMRLDLVLAAAGEQMEQYELTLGSELGAMEHVRDNLKHKAGFIRSKNSEISVQPTIDGMTAMIEQYQTLLPESDRQRALEPSQSGAGDE